MEDKGIYTKKGIKVNDKTFNIKLYIKRSSIIFELESPEKKYSNSFSLNDLIRIYKSYFIDYTDINEAFKGLIELFDYDLIYTEGDNSINFKIKKNNNKEISFPLKEKKDEENQINYDSLSDEMKKIINSNELILGIDLGTTYSCASIILDDKKIIIENSLGNRTTPSYVLFLDKNKVNVGELAKLQPSYHKNIIYNSKKLIGKNINDKEVQLIKDNYSFVIKEDNYSKFLKIEVDGDYYYPEQISAMVLKKIVNDSEYYLYKLLKKKIKIKNAVITAPAYFNQKQRKAILNAANIIGLNVKRIINEPTAASLAYLYDSFMNEKKNIIVLDFGGGTFDITLLHLTQENNSSYCDIICTGGDPNFGGEKFDEKLMKKCIESIQKNNLSLNKKLPQNIRLKRACENAKIKLSSQDDTRIFLEGYLPSINIDLSITTKEFEEYCEDLFNEFEGIIQKFLTDNHVDKKEINEVIPIGGSTLIPKIRSTFTKLFPDSKINYELDPKEVVAIGAAIQGGILSKLHSLKDYKLFDITNCSLGVETVGKEMSIIIKKHSHIPIEHKKEYSNAYDNATELLIKVYEGEDENNIKNDIFLGEFKIKNLPKNKKAREIKLDVIFNIDENSLLYVKAIEKANQKNFEDNLFNLGKNNEITKKKNKLIVEDPNSLMKIIDNLKNKENSMNYVDINLYIDTIKDLIIESENKIIKLEKKKKFNEIIVEEKYIIKKFGNFIKEQLLKDKTEEYEKKLILSYVKYYFKKIVRFLKKYKEDTSLKKEILEEKIIDSILETIQFFEPEIIFEIVEDFTDDKELFEKSIISLIKNLYGKFEFKTSNFKFSDIYGYEYDKKRMNNLKVEVENILTLFNKLNSSQIPADFKLNTEYLESFKLKLKIKQFIIDHRNNENNSFYFSLFGIRFYKKEKKDELNSLLQQYNNQKKYIDIGLLNELNNLSSKKNNNTTRCDLFLEVFNQKEDSEKNESFLLSIFEEFNVLESDQNYNIKFNRDLYYEWKNIYDGSNAQRKLDLLNKALIKYNASLELIKNKYNDEKLKEVYRNIIKLIDIIKDRINGRK